MKTTQDLSTTESLNVGMGDLQLTETPGKLHTLGLGSCVALVLYDRKAQVAGMAHVMLPKSPAGDTAESKKPGKFADTAILNLLEELDKQGAEKRRIRAKIAGGAKMFNLASASPLMAIGRQNIDAVTEHLKSHGIPLDGKDTGGTRGRSVTFDTGSWRMTVRIIGEGTKTL
jgi:chemotaxis protein CheD